MSDTWLWATVTATGPLRVRLDGDDDPLDSTPVATCSPAVGARVLCLLHDRQLVVVSVRVSP